MYKNYARKNDELKQQVSELDKEMEIMKNKMASLCIPTSSNQDAETAKSLDFMSKEYDDIKVLQLSMGNNLKRMSTKLEGISIRVNAIDEAIEEMLKYSYQYNVKIFGIPQRGPRESATEAADICLSLFNKMGATMISPSDIDIAHRIPNRTPSSYPPAIVCKFTRRLAKEQVMNRKKEAARINVSEIIGLHSATAYKVQNKSL